MQLSTFAPPGSLSLETLSIDKGGGHIDAPDFSARGVCATRGNLVRPECQAPGVRLACEEVDVVQPHKEGGDVDGVSTRHRYDGKVFRWITDITTPLSEIYKQFWVFGFTAGGVSAYQTDPMN